MDDDKMILDDSDLFCPDIWWTKHGGPGLESSATKYISLEDAANLNLPNNLTVGHALAALVALADEPRPEAKARALAFLKTILASLEQINMTPERKQTVVACEQCVWERVQEAQRKRDYELVQYWVDIFTGAGLDHRASALHDLWNEGHETEAVVLANHYANNNTIKDME